MASPNDPLAPLRPWGPFTVKGNCVVDKDGNVVVAGEIEAEIPALAAALNMALGLPGHRKAHLTATGFGLRHYDG